MEDLKKIQEFFSKPLEEVTKSQMLKKAKKGSYPATLVAIENGKVVAQEKVSTPQEAPAAHSVMSKKYPNANIRLEDSTGKILEENVDKKYSDFLVALRDSGVTNMFGAAPYLQAEFGLDKREAREVLANWMRSFGESLNENVFVEAFKLEKALKGMGYNVKVKYLDDFGKDVFEIYFQNPADADDSIFYDAKKLGYDNVRVFANPNEYNTGIYFDPDKATQRNKAKEVSKTALDKVRDAIKKVMTGDYEPTITENEADMEIKVGDYQTQYFHMCPGAVAVYQDIEDKVEDMGLAIRSAKLQDALFAMEKSALESGATEAEVFAAQSIADQIMAMAAMMGLDKEHSYIQGHVEKIKGALNEITEAKVEVDDTTEFKLDLRHLLDKHAIKETIKFIKENNPSATTEEVIAELKEIKELGEVLEEKLCKKGEAYRKRRMAAGEKSSAYLSGRAVKVYKGQISGRSKRKKRKRKKK